MLPQHIAASNLRNYGHSPESKINILCSAAFCSLTRVKTLSFLFVYSFAVADPGFPRGGGANSPRAPTYDFAKFSQKLHEIERIWTLKVLCIVYSLPQIVELIDVKQFHNIRERMIDLIRNWLTFVLACIGFYRFIKTTAPVESLGHTGMVLSGGSKGRREGRPRSEFFQFHAVFGKFW